MSKKPKSNQKSKSPAANLKKLSLFAWQKAILAILITAVLGVSLLFSETISTALFGQTAPPAPSNPTQTSDDALSVHFLDVGQGDCTIVEFPDGKTMIIDAGDTDSKISQKILNYIDQKFDIKYFDYAILTHPDADHAGGMDNVLDKYPAMTVYRPNIISSRSGFTDPALLITEDSEADPNLKFWSSDAEGTDDVYLVSTKVYADFLQQAYKPFTIDGQNYTPEVIISDGRRGNLRPDGKAPQDITGTAPESGEYKVEFYSPQSPNYGTKSTPEKNDYSNILTITYRGFCFLISGDAEHEAEEAFVETYASLTFDIDVIKAGHHGSRTSSSVEYLELVTSPQKRENIFVIFSCGEGNSYGHPHPETLERYASLGFSSDNLLRTDTLGDIVLTVKQNQSGQFVLFYGETTVASNDQIPAEYSWYAIAGTLWVGSESALLFVIKTKKSKSKKS